MCWRSVPGLEDPYFFDHCCESWLLPDLLTQLFADPRTIYCHHARHSHHGRNLSLLTVADDHTVLSCCNVYKNIST